MEPGFGAANLLHDLLEGFIHRGGRQMVSQLVREHKAAIFVAFAISEPVLQLPEVDTLQDGCDGGGKCQGAALAVDRKLCLQTSPVTGLSRGIPCRGENGRSYAHGYHLHPVFHG